jgi:hypothetical protein
MKRCEGTRDERFGTEQRLILRTGYGGMAGLPLLLWCLLAGLGERRVLNHSSRDGSLALADANNSRT